MKNSVFLFLLFLAGIHAKSADEKLVMKTASDFTDGLKNQPGGVLLMDKARSYYSKKRLTLDPSKKYRLSGEFQLIGNKPVSVIFSADQYTEDNMRIAGLHVWAITGTETELTSPAAVGDRVLRVKDTSKWIRNPRLFSIYHVAFRADKSGKQDDLPNFDISSALGKFEVKDGFTEVELKTPLKKAYPKGTPVRLHLDRCFFGVTPGFFKPDGQWKKVEVVIQPMPPLPLKTNLERSLWPGAGKIGILVMPWPMKPFPEGTGIRMRNLELSEL